MHIMVYTYKLASLVYMDNTNLQYCILIAILHVCMYLYIQISNVLADYTLLFFLYNAISEHTRR